MKKQLLILMVLFAFIGLSAKAQNEKAKLDASKAEGGATKSAILISPLKSKTGIHEMDTKWQSVLTHVMSENESPNNELLQKLKEEKTKEKFASSNDKSIDSENSTQTITPVIGTNFGGTSSTGCPLDNTIAISNGGKIISLVNNSINYYNMSGTLLYTSDIWTWYGDNTLVNNICDPKVLYDSGSDKFIFYSQTCDAISANSKIIIAFSTTNDPQGSWNTYEFSGNPLGDNSWFDYPKIAVSNNEFYVTGNLFYQGGGYNQSIIYQMNKLNGYAGVSINYQYWSGIAGNPFTLLPVSYGQQGNYGPGVYLVSTETASSSTIHFYDLTNDIGSSPVLNHYTVSTTSYSGGGQAGQLGGSDYLDNGDTRTQSGFYLNGIIHFVFHSDIGSGWNGINYNRLNVSLLTNTSSTFGLSGSFDYCYPAVSSFATSATDKSVMIVFERAGTTIYPETRVVNCDNAMAWSSSTLVKGGASYLSQCYDPAKTSERWGDYTGISRKNNSSSPSVWVSAAYGSSSHYWNTWIAQINATGSGAGITENNNNESVNLYPNPVNDIFKTEFVIDKTQLIKINIVDIEGRVVKQLYEGLATQGENVYTFNKGNLSNGFYFLQIINSTNQTIKNEKFIIGN
jgi:hypothetical protein